MEREMPATVMGRAFWFVSGDVNPWEAVFVQLQATTTSTLVLRHTHGVMCYSCKAQK